MKTITINLYKFEELPQEAQQVAIKGERANCLQLECECYNEAEADVFMFLSQQSYGTVSHTHYNITTGFVSENIFHPHLNGLGGIRLRTWFVNNLTLSRPKIFFLKGKKRVSKIAELTDNLNESTWLNDLFVPIQEFVDKPSEKTFYEVISECFEYLSKELKKTCAEYSEEAYIRERLIDEGSYYLENGTKYYED